MDVCWVVRFGEGLKPRPPHPVARCCIKNLHACVLALHAEVCIMVAVMTYRLLPRPLPIFCVMLLTTLTACSQKRSQDDAGLLNPRLRTPPSTQQRLDRLNDITEPHTAGMEQRLERSNELARRHLRPSMAGDATPTR